MFRAFATYRAYSEAVAACAAVVDGRQVTALRDLIDQARSDRCAVYAAGNGGMATVAEHLAIGLSLNALRETGRGLRVSALSASGAVLSAAANDFGADRMFAAQVEAMGQPGDLLVTLSASGQSANLVAAMRAAQALGMRTAAVVGTRGSVSEGADAVVDLGTEVSAVAEDVAIMVSHFVYGTFMAGPA